MAQNPTEHPVEHSALSHISRSYDYSGDMSRVDPNTLQEYNTNVKLSVDNRDQAQNRSLDDLPNEVLIDIIQEAVASWVRSPQHSQRLLLLSLVNRRWANLILQTSYFWTIIVLTQNLEDLEATTVLQLELSGDRSLELEYRMKSELVYKVAHLLRPHLHRVSHLCLRPEEGKHSGTDPFFPHTVFPSLRHFTTTHVHSDIKARFLSQHEAFMPYADLASLGFASSLKVVGGDLVSVHITSITEAALQYVEDVTTLKHVHMKHMYSNSADWSTAIEGRRHPLSWEVLESRHIPWQVMHRLLSRCASLNSLKLSINTEDASALLNMLPRLVLLEHIVIWLFRNSIDGTFGAPNYINREETGIRTMEAYLGAYPYYHSPGIGIGFLHPLLRMTPRLESFRLFGYRGKGFDFTEIDKLQHLRKLTLDRSVSTIEPNKTKTRHILTSPSLEVVEIHSTNDTLNSFGSLTASRLIFTPGYQSSGPKLDIIRVRGSDWPSLETLSLWMDPHSASKINHTVSTMSLRRLNLLGRAIATTMIHHLAVHPNELPLLDTLELTSCPEWDILFIMLEKRLLVQMSGVKPIERILFGRILPTRLKRGLALLLAGHIVSRPSNYELSMQGNLDIFLDADITGCVECHLYLHPCDLPVNNASLDWPEPLIFIAYPKAADEILRTQAVRYIHTEGIYRPEAGGVKCHRALDCNRLKETDEVSRNLIDS